MNQALGRRERVATDRGGERPILHTLRWISALLVLNGHAVGATFGEPGSYPAGSLRWELVSLMANWPPVAVVVFFVVSGYLVGGGVMRRGATLDSLGYAINRFSRIYIVLIPALALTFLLDGLAHHIDPLAAPYSTLWEVSQTGYTPVFQRYQLTDVLGSLASIPPGIVSDPMGSNIPLWSLGYEWLFYFLLPFALLATAALHRYSRARIAILALVLAALLGGARQGYLAFYWTIWIFGAFCGSADKVPALGRNWLIAGAGLVALMMAADNLVDSRVRDLVVGVMVGLLLTQRVILSLGFGERIDKALSGISYSLYLTHAPVLLFLSFLFYRAGVLLAPGSFQSGFELLFYVAGMAACLVTAAAFGQLFERNTGALRAVLYRLRAIGTMPVTVLPTEEADDAGRPRQARSGE